MRLKLSSSCLRSQEGFSLLKPYIIDITIYNTIVFFFKYQSFPAAHWEDSSWIFKNKFEMRRQKILRFKHIF